MNKKSINTILTSLVQKNLFRHSFRITHCMNVLKMVYIDILPNFRIIFVHFFKDFENFTMEFGFLQYKVLTIVFFIFTAHESMCCDYWLVIPDMLLQTNFHWIRQEWDTI